MDRRPIREWVRWVDGRFILTWQVQDHGDWIHGGERPLTWRERLLWRLAARTPTP